MIRSPSWRAALLVVAGLLWIGPAAADDLVVMTSGTFTAAYLELGPRFERASHHRLVTATTSMGVGEQSIPSRLQRREAADVVIVDDAALGQLIADGLVLAGSRVPLASSGIGMAVRAGTPKPDISTLDGLRRALLQAKSVAYSSSVSGRYVSTELYERLGIAAEMAAKSRRIEGERVGAVVARGDAEIGFQQTSELLPVPGITYVGPLPAAVQQVSVFSAGVAAGSKNPDAARALIRFLASAEAAAVVAKTGLEPVAAQQPTKVTMSFTPRSETLGFTLAAEEYRRIWQAEGTRVIEAMERITGLRFPERHIDAQIYEGPSVAGVRYNRDGLPVGGRDPMRLRASYKREEKKGTLVHELAHWMNAQLKTRPAGVDEHRLLFLYLYELYVDLYGKAFADREVAFGRTLKGLYDYDTAWTWALAMTSDARLARFREVVIANRK